MSGPDDLRRIAEELAPDRWPDTDVIAIGELAQRLAGLAARLRAVANTVETVHHVHRIGAGAFDQATIDTAARLADDATGTAGGLAVSATTLAAFADLTTRTRQKMAVVATIADRDRLLGMIGSAVGDDTPAVRAASAGRAAMTAAGDDYADEAAAHGTAATTTATTDDPQHPAAATSGMMPMGGLGTMGVGAVGVGAVGAAAAAGRNRREPGTDDDEPPELTRAEHEDLVRYARTLAADLDGRAGGWVQVAVGIGHDRAQGRATVVGTSDPVPYLRVGMRVRTTDEVAGDGRAPEIAVVDHLRARGYEPIAVASPSTPSAAARAVLATAGVTSIIIDPTRT
ncbi:hypothetical protein ABLE92_04285 [Gordonia sp. VNQ95]|uniref:hypothetical protein n=1 Tax=Gordonia TaxID=2053 RepID=UPI0032B347CF